jgi:hypothetical protein
MYGFSFLVFDLQLHAVLHDACVQLQIRRCHRVSHVRKPPNARFQSNPLYDLQLHAVLQACVHATANPRLLSCSPCAKTPECAFLDSSNTIQTTACSCMQYCMLRACICKSEYSIMFGILEKLRVREISSFHARKPIWPRGAREVREICIPWPISPRTLGRSPINDIPFDFYRRALQLFKRKLSDPIPKLYTYRLGT